MVLTPPSKQTPADALGERNGCDAPLGESALWALSTGTCSLRPSARASRPPWRRRTDAPGYRPAGSRQGLTRTYEITCHRVDEVGISPVHLGQKFFDRLHRNVGPTLDQFRSPASHAAVVHDVGHLR